MQLTVKQARLLAELTQLEVATELGVHKQTYVKWEKNPDLFPMGFARRFLTVVGRRMDEIFFEVESTFSRQSHHNTA